MPTYKFRNKDTDEEIEITMRISELDSYKKEHPNYIQLITGFPGMITQHGMTITKAGHEWQDHLKRIHKNAGRKSTIKT